MRALFLGVGSFTEFNRLRGFVVARTISEDILSQADVLLAASQHLDYPGIIAHKPMAVEKLKAVISDLRINSGGSSELLSDYASKQAGPGGSQAQRAPPAADKGGRVAESEGAIKVRRQAMTQRLSGEGFADHIGCVYNSFSQSRSTPFNQVPHRIGLPPFDVVVAADFSPVAGMHGVFISANEIMSIILPSEGGGATSWQVLSKKGFQNEEEMLEYVTLIAAGFDVP